MCTLSLGVALHIGSQVSHAMTAGVRLGAKGKEGRVLLYIRYLQENGLCNPV